VNFAISLNHSMTTAGLISGEKEKCGRLERGEKAMSAKYG